MKSLLVAPTAALLAMTAAHARFTPPPVVFDGFKYSGQDAAATAPTSGHYRNPILTGFYPDPSICRVGKDYYLTNSTFAYYPGLPVFHSTDLVNWTQIGNAIDRPDQLRYAGLDVSAGIFAPAITCHDGTFYLICTMVGSDGNFVLTAKNPAGPWSDPHILNFGGIDPSLFFDDDGRAWIVNNDAPDGKPLYDGHRAIRIQEFDPKAMQVFGPRNVIVNGGVDLSTKPIWIEGPHLFKRDGWYYLTCAEGGTGPGHAQVIFRSRKVTGPYVPWNDNPILTQRDLPSTVPGAVSCAGHASLVIGPDHHWWATFLGVRPYDGQYSLMGRETFLLPVTWTDDGWPVILPHGQRVPLLAKSPAGASVHANTKQPPLSGNFTWSDSFTEDSLPLHWLMLRAPEQPWWHFDRAAGTLAISPRHESLSGLGNPSYLCRRVQHSRFEAGTLLTPSATAGNSAGMAIVQSNHYYYALTVSNDDSMTSIRLECVRDGKSKMVKTVRVPKAAKIGLRIRGDAAKCSFDYSLHPSVWIPLAEDEDATMLTSAVAGGFVGATVGLYAHQD